MGIHLLEKILIAAGTGCLIYYLVIVLYVGFSADFSWFWILSGSILVLGGVGSRYGILQRIFGYVPGALLWLGLSVIFAGTFVFACLMVSVLGGMRQNTSKTPDYLIVLGAQIRGTIPSRSLVKRLDKAIEAAGEYPETVIIVSGGQGPGEDISEAECMQKYLLEHGISEERVIMETNSTTTLENLLYVGLENPACCGKCVGIISNNFHMYRAMQIAKQQKYQDVIGIPAASDPILQVHFVVRECFALLNEYRKGSIVHPLWRWVRRHAMKL